MINAVAKGIFDTLQANVALMAAITGTYHVIAPQSATFAYLTFGMLTDNPLGTFTSPSAVEDTEWWVNVHSKAGSKNAGTIAGLLHTALDNASLTVTGYSALKCVRDYIGSMIYDPETKAYMIPHRYRIQVDKN